MNIDTILIIALVLLIFLAAFFSASETSMMSINRYRLKHLVRKGNVKAKRVSDLLSRTDRLLGMLIIGSTFANIFASSITAMISVHYFGDLGVLIATAILTLIILIFAETAPKTLAALYPEKVSFRASRLLQVILKIIYPLIWLVNGIANSILRLCRIPIKQGLLEPLSVDELRSVVHETSPKISKSYKKMLMRILDLEELLVEDIMVPRNEINGIDISQSLEKILEQLIHYEHAHIPLYENNIDNVQGMLNLRTILITLQQKKLTKEDLIALAEPVYFVPQEAAAHRQLLNFQQQKKATGLVVDEYGDIQGLITLQDIIKEIVGEFAEDIEDVSRLIQQQTDGSYLVSGSMEIRDLNRLMNWHLPTDGPRTLSGLVIEHLEMIPREGIASRIAGYPIEVIKVQYNMVKQTRIWPNLYQPPTITEE